MSLRSAFTAVWAATSTSWIADEISVGTDEAANCHEEVDINGPAVSADTEIAAIALIAAIAVTDERWA
jgi:hypothetical protein